MTITEAIQMIVDDCNCPSVNYAVNYAKVALHMLSYGMEDTKQFKVQCLYIQGNISNWRAGANSKFTKEQIKEARSVIKNVNK